MTATTVTTAVAAATDGDRPTRVCRSQAGRRSTPPLLLLPVGGIGEHEGRARTDHDLVGRRTMPTSRSNAWRGRRRPWWHPARLAAMTGKDTGRRLEGAARPPRPRHSGSHRSNPGGGHRARGRGTSRRLWSGSGRPRGSASRIEKRTTVRTEAQHLKPRYAQHSWKPARSRYPATCGCARNSPEWTCLCTAARNR